MKLSDYVVKFFERQKVKDIFMVTGGGCMHLVDSFGKSSKIKYWCTEHEQSAAMAAEAYSKIKNDLGLVLTTSGPGATNTVTGVLDCYQDSTPVVFLSGQSKSKQTVLNSGIEGLRQFGVQEANIIPIVSSITKYAVEISDPKSIRYHLEKAVYFAKNGRPGPVWISIPLDIQSANIDTDALKAFDTNDSEIKTKPSDFEISYCIEKISKAERPVIIGGHGIRLAEACKELDTFVTNNRIPVVTPIMGIDILSGDHPCNIGRVGTKGTRAGNFAMQNADLILVIGSRLSVSVVGHEYELFAREAKVIIVDIDTIEHKKRTISNIDSVINCDAKEFLTQMLHMPHLNFSEWLSICQKWKNKYPVVLPEYNEDKNGINYYKFIDILNKNTNASMPIVADAGSAFYVVSQTVNLKEAQRYITTGGTATMGFTVPAAIGVAVSMPNSSVVAITGEGSFMQNLQELEVIKYHGFNIKLFIMNNKGYFSIHQTQNRYFNGNFVGESADSGISFTSIQKLAEAFEIDYFRFETIQKAENLIESILTSTKPCLIEVVVNSDMEIIPTASSKMKNTGVMISKPLEDMYPFLPRQEFLDNMIVKTVNEE